VQRRKPHYLRVGNGSEFSGRLPNMWANRHNVRIDFSRPGKPTDSCFVETFNGALRDECLNVHWFESLERARAIIEAWRQDYNASRPHLALAETTPSEYARRARICAKSPGVGGAED
jgi:putative transposase